MNTSKRNRFSFSISAALLLITSQFFFGCPDRSHHRGVVLNDVVLSSIAPGIVANSLTPTITGTSQPGTTVYIFTDYNCTTNPPQFSAQADANGHFSVQVTVAPNSNTGFLARAVDNKGNYSNCSPMAIYYFNDVNAPAAPVLANTNPASPANNAHPILSGSAETGTNVTVYFSNNCTGPVVGSVQADPNTGLFSILLDFSPNERKSISALTTDIAGNVSTCSNTLVYEYDNIPVAPGALAIQGTNPASPSSNIQPTVFGTSEPGSTVSIHHLSDCSDAAINSGTATAGGSFAIPVIVTANTASVFYAKAVDLAQNTPICSTTSVSYLHDSDAPTAPTLQATNPASPANFNLPIVQGSAEPNSVVRIYKDDPTCTATTFVEVSADAMGGFQKEVAVLDNTTTHFYATARDAAGNTSSCTTQNFIYLEDSVPASQVVFTFVDPITGSNNNSPTVHGTTEPLALVTIYKNSTCTGTAVTGSADSNGDFAITVPVADDEVATLYATSTDASLNVSGCSSSTITYAEDSTAPVAPLLTGTAPMSPSSSLTLLVLGQAEVGAKIRIYRTTDCSGSPEVTTTITSADFTAPINAFDNTTTALSATAEDAAGNVSGCSSEIYYIHDSLPPQTIVFQGTTPASPADNNSPEIYGLTDPGTFVELFTNSGCSGVAVGSTTSDGMGVFSVSGGSVGDNSTTTYYGRFTDIAGNTTCSVGSISYVEQTKLRLDLLFVSDLNVGQVRVQIPSYPDQICRDTCEIYALPGETATLIPETGVGGTFAGWSTNSCTGSGACGISFPPTQSAVAVAFTRIGVRQVAVGTSHSCAVLDNGTLACWGSNDAGQLGVSAVSQTDVPTLVPGITAADKVLVGNRHTCVVDNNKLKCWGLNEDGQVGKGSAGPSMPGDETPFTTINGNVITPVNVVSGGYSHTCVLNGLGGVFGVCWGLNSDGQVGNQSAATPVTSPALVRPLARQYKAISAGFNHTCAVGSDNKPYCWGKNDHSQLGDSGTTSRNTSGLVTITGVNFKTITTGNSYTLALTAAGDVYGWGDNSTSQLGDGAVSTGVGVAPAQITTFAGAVDQIDSSFDNEACAVMSSGELYCWGDNSHGQLGLGTGNTTNATTPQLVSTLPTVSSVAVGPEHTCAVLPDRSVQCWGRNNAGQLGSADGLNAQKEAPQAVFGI